jgi:hypothetical protein
VLSVEAEAVWAVLLELELALEAVVLAVLLPPFSNWERSACNWASSDCSWVVNWPAGVEPSLLLALLALLALLDEALTELVLLLVESELPAPWAPGGGAGGCCRDASSSSSTLDNSVELSLLLADEDALLADDALDASALLALDALSPADRPDRKLMFSSWK